MSKWISVKDKMPENGIDVLLVVYGNVRIGMYYSEENFYLSATSVKYISEEVTHWQPLPKPPEKEIGKPKITKQKDGSTIVHFKIKAEAPNKPTEVI